MSQSRINVILPAIFFSTVFCLFIACNSSDKPQDSPTPPSETPEITVPTTPPRAEDWHMYMNDLMFSGRSPDQKLKPPLQLVWKFKTGGPIEASPIVVNDVVYIGSSDGKMYALDAKAWGIKWVYDAGSAIRFSAVASGGRVYFCTRDSKCYAVNANTGKKLWEYKTEGWVDGPPVVYDGTVYIGSFPTRIYLLDAIHGKMKSQRNSRIRIDGNDYGCVNGVFRPVMPQYNENLWRGYTEGSDGYPVIANGFAYIGARNGKIHAFNVHSKTKAGAKSEAWSHQVRGPINAAPAISDGYLYATSLDGKIYAFSNLTDSSPVATDERQRGIVTRDNVPVFAEQEDASAIFGLNDGTELPIVSTTEKRYQVELPNRENAWLNRHDFGEFEDTEGIMFNTNYCETPQILHLVEGAEYPYWSPNGELVAMLKRTDLSGSYWKASELWIMDRTGKQRKKLYEGIFYNPHVSWSLDSRLIAFEVKEDDERYIYTADWELGRVKKIVKGKAPAWSPTANQLAFRRQDIVGRGGVDFVYLINSDGSGGRLVARASFKKPLYTYTFLQPPSWSRDGMILAFNIVYDHKVGNTSVPYAGIRLQSVDGDRLEQIPTQHQYIRQIRWSPDQTYLAYVLSGGSRSDPVYDKRLHLYPYETSATQGNSLKHRVLKHTMPAWAPTDITHGRVLAFFEREDCAGLHWKVWVYDLDAGKKYAIARTSMELTSMVWMPDGKSLCIWHTSDYLRDNKYLPADTKGWIVPVTFSP